MSERTFARPFGFLLVLLAALAAFPGLARADDKDDLIRGLQEDKKALQQLLKKRKELLKEQEAKVAELEKQIASLRDQLMAAQIEARTLKARVQEARKGRADERLLANPPPRQVEGVVKQVEEKTGLIVIDRGADAGLAEGHTLEVFRLQPQPKYLGALRIIRVSPRESVGQMIKPPPGTTIQAGDRVASRLEGK